MIWVSAELTIAVLTHDEFQRIEETYLSELYVKHMVANKDCSSKLEMLRRCGCYFDGE